MPLDIPPALAALPASVGKPTLGASPGTGLAALFDTLLAQSVARVGASAPGVPPKASPRAALTGAARPAVTAQTVLPAGQPASVVRTDTKTFSVKSGVLTAKKARPRDAATTGAGTSAWPPVTIALTPNETPLPTTVGLVRVMDATSRMGGGSLSQNLTKTFPRAVQAAEAVPDAPAPAVSVLTPTALRTTFTEGTVVLPTSGVIVPNEASVVVPTEPHAVPVTAAALTPQTPVVPNIPVQAAQEVPLATDVAPPTVVSIVPAAPPPAQTSVSLVPGTAPSAPLPVAVTPVLAPPPVPTAAPVATSSKTSVTKPHFPDGAQSHSAMTAMRRDDAVPVLQKVTPEADNQGSDGAGKNASSADTGQQGTEPHKPLAEASKDAPLPLKTATQATATVPAVDAPGLKTPDAVPVTAAPMPAADRTQMLRQVSEGLQTMAARAAGNGQRQVTVQLHPKDWGQVNISVTMTPSTQPDGKTTTQVVAHVVADQPAVKAALQTHQADLRQSLKEAGLHLDKLTITVRPAEGGAQAGLGDGRRESRSGEGIPFSASATGPGAGGGASGGGGNPSPFAAFAQGNPGGQGRQPAQPDQALAAQAAGAEAEATPAPITTGRVDTRA